MRVTRQSRRTAKRIVTRQSNSKARRQSRRTARRGGARTYGKPNNSTDGFSGAFCGRIHDATGVVRDEHYFSDIDEAAYQYIDEKLQIHITTHLKAEGADLDTDPEFFCQAGYGGDRGEGKVEFLLGDKIAKPPPMEFKYMGEKYTMLFRFCD